MSDEKKISDLRGENERLKSEVAKLKAQLAREDKQIDLGEARLRIAYEASVQSLVQAIESKDPFTRGRYELVSRYAVVVGRRLGLDEEALDCLRTGGLLMDIGKVGIDNSLLTKAEPITREEEKIIMSHVAVGAQILDPIVYPWDISTLIYQHHERFDGSGYPEGLKGDEISMEAGILGICDSFIAMMADRAYRGAYGREFTIKELKQESGKKYDPRIVEAFIGVLESGEAPAIENVTQDAPSGPDEDPVN